MANRGSVDVGLLRSSYDLRVGLPIIITTIFCFGLVMANPFKAVPRISALSASHTQGSVAQSIKMTANYPQVQHLAPIVQTNAGYGSSAASGSLAGYAAQAENLTSSTQVQTVSPQAATSTSESGSTQTNMNSLQPTTTKPKTTSSPSTSPSPSNDVVNSLLSNTSKTLKSLL